MQLHQLAFLANNDATIDGMLRDLWATLCQLIYRLIAFLYELFINIAQVQFLQDKDILAVYKRVTMIFTIIMVFYITFELVKYVVQPEMMTDKEQGAGNIAKKIVIVIVLIAFIPNIFSWAYKIQNVIIKNEIISKIVLGKTNTQMSTYGRAFSSNMLGLFYYYDDGPGGVWEGENKDCDGIKCKNVVSVNLGTLNEYGTLEFLHHGLNYGDKVTVKGDGKKSFRYYITFDGLLAVLVGCVICYILVLYCIDAGTRVGQLAFLQIIAPIPIIGYLSPKKDGIFQKWVKQCFATYLDLFIRITVIYLVLMLCDMLGQAYHSGTLFNNIGSMSSTSKAFLYIFIVMGLLLLGQRVPKMLKELFPSSTAASGNFGLKAGERVAPMAARTIGAGLGFTSNVVRGGIRRAAWRRARNKANGWATGFAALTKEGRETNRRKREEERQHKQEERNAQRRNASLKKDQANRAAFDKARNRYEELQDNDPQTKALKEGIRKALADGDKDKARELAAQLKAKNEQFMKSKEHQAYVDKAKPIIAQRQKNLNEARDRVEAAKADLRIAQQTGDATRIAKAQERLNNAQNEYNTIANPIKTAKTKVEAAQRELSEAQASGDTDRIEKAQTALNAAQQEYNSIAPEGVKNARSDLEAAQAELAAAEASGDALRIKEAQEKVKNAETALSTAQDTLATNMVISGSQLAGTNRRIVTEAEDQYARAQAATSKARDKGDPDAIAAAEAAEAAAKENLANARKQVSESMEEYRSGDSKEMARQYDLAQEKATEQVLLDKNKHFQGLGGSVLSTLGSGVRGATTGAHATKLEDIRKQVSQANKDDIANVKAVQKYYDEGGTGWADRTVEQIKKDLGTPTAYEEKLLKIQSYEPKIKTLDAQTGLTQDVKSTADAAEDRLKEKIEDLAMVVGTDESISVGSGDRVPIRDASGKLVLDSAGNIQYERNADGSYVMEHKSVRGDGSKTLAQLYRDEKARASQKRTEAEEAVKKKKELEAAGKTGTEEYRQVSAEAEYLNMIAANAEYAVTQFQKYGARHEFSKILKQFASSPNKEKTLEDLRKDDAYDGVAVEKVYSALRSIDVAKSNPAIVADMRKMLTAEQFNAFMSGDITSFPMLDKIKIAAINAGNAYERDSKALKEKQRKEQTSNETGAQKAANDFNGSGSGGK